MEINMQKIFKAWLIVIFVLALIASYLVGIESTIFGILLLPLLIVVGIIIIFGSTKSKT
jgi:hypothetical protein